ncbi:MAG: dihydrodipicolinate synthase family protein [Lachnospiraceae bacterium]|nr:dihydrodipicolinate synthase family protein [Lachnospiraceae bacterium]
MTDFGYYAPIATIFNSDYTLDIEGNKRLYDYVINGGLDGIVLMGSTGEFFSMTTQQKKQLIDIACDYIKGKCKLYVGTGCLTTEDTIELSNYALEKGADAVMIVGPYYFSLEKDNIVSYFDDVAKEIKGNIFMYNFAERTGYDLPYDVVLQVRRNNKNVIGVKDTVTQMGHTRKILTTLLKEFPNFIVYSGYDENYAHNVTSGGAGCIGALSNICPDVFAGWGRALKEENFKEITRYQNIVNRLMDLYDIASPFMPVLKKALVIKGVIKNELCTTPFRTVNEEQVKQIEEILADVNNLMVK